MEASNSAGSGVCQAMTFVVRLSRDDTGRLTGVVERVRAGEKARSTSSGSARPARNTARG